MAYLLVAAILVVLALGMWALHLVRRQQALLVALAKAEKDGVDAQHDADQAKRELADYLCAIEQHVLVSVADAQGFIIDANQRMVEVSGYTHEEMMGMDHRQLDSDIATHDTMQELRATLRRGQIWRGELCSRTKQGTLYWVDSAIVPMKDGTGTVRQYLRVGLDVTARKHTEAEMARRATHDALTDLPNRNLLRDRMQQALESCRRTGDHAATLFLDLNRFKQVNDELGHDVGDQLLVAVAQRIKTSVRSEETVARLGGDEFVVFVPRLSDPSTAHALAHQLTLKLSEPFNLSGQVVHIGASIGVAIFPTHADSVDSLLKTSDASMYQLKQETRRAS